LRDGRLVTAAARSSAASAQRNADGSVRLSKGDLDGVVSDEPVDAVAIHVC
jgi:hypothetical protein